MCKCKLQSFNKELTFEQKNYLEQIKIVQKLSSLWTEETFTFDQIIIQKQSFLCSIALLNKQILLNKQKKYSTFEQNKY